MLTDGGRIFGMRPPLGSVVVKTGQWEHPGSLLRVAYDLVSVAAGAERLSMELVRPPELPCEVTQHL